MEFQFWGPYFSTSWRSFSSSPGRQWPLGHKDAGFPPPSDVLVVDDDDAIGLCRPEKRRRIEAWPTRELRAALERGEANAFLVRNELMATSQRGVCI